MDKTITMKPTWQFAVRIYIEVLKNPDATESAKYCAEDELMRLAKMVDELQNGDEK